MDKSMYLKAIQSIYDDDVMDFPMVQKRYFNVLCLKDVF
jgi:hypothetical protein